MQNFSLCLVMLQLLSLIYLSFLVFMVTIIQTWQTTIPEMHFPVYRRLHGYRAGGCKDHVSWHQTFVCFSPSPHPCVHLTRCASASSCEPGLTSFPMASASGCELLQREQCFRNFNIVKILHSFVL